MDNRRILLGHVFIVPELKKKSMACIFSIDTCNGCVYSKNISNDAGNNNGESTMDVRKELMDLALKFQNAAEHAKSHQLDAEEKEEAGELMEGYGEFWKGTSFAYKNAKNDLRDFIWRLQRYGY